MCVCHSSLCWFNSWVLPNSRATSFFLTFCASFLSNGPSKNKHGCAAQLRYPLCWEAMTCRRPHRAQPWSDQTLGWRYNASALDVCTRASWLPICCVLFGPDVIVCRWQVARFFQRFMGFVWPARRVHTFLDLVAQGFDGGRTSWSHDVRREVRAYVMSMYRRHRQDSHHHMWRRYFHHEQLRMSQGHRKRSLVGEDGDRSCSVSFGRITGSPVA